MHWIDLFAAHYQPGTNRSGDCSDTRLTSRIHALEELAVVLRIAKLVEQEVDRVHGAHRIEDAAQNVHLFQNCGIGQQFFLARARSRYVDCGERAFVGDLAVEDQFGVARTLEFFENHFVHAAAGINERSRNDGQRTAFFDVARGPEKAFGTLKRVGIHAARQYLARRWDDRIVGTAKACNRIEENDHIALMLYQALGLLYHHFRDLNVT